MCFSSETICQVQAISGMHVNGCTSDHFAWHPGPVLSPSNKVPAALLGPVGWEEATGMAYAHHHFPDLDNHPAKFKAAACSKHIWPNTALTPPPPAFCFLAFSQVGVAFLALGQKCCMPYAGNNTREYMEPREGANRLPWPFPLAKSDTSLKALLPPCSIWSHTKDAFTHTK